MTQPNWKPGSSTMRQLRDDGPQQELVVITAVDPLNLIGVLSKHDRVPRIASNRVAYLDGWPIAALRGSVTEILENAPEVHLPTALYRMRHVSLLPSHAEYPMELQAES